MPSGVKKIFCPGFPHFLGRNTVTPAAEWEAAKQRARFRFAQREKEAKGKKNGKGSHLVVVPLFSPDLTSRRAHSAREGANCSPWSSL